jgi:hypothetical protein
MDLLAFSLSFYVLQSLPGKPKADKLKTLTNKAKVMPVPSYLAVTHSQDFFVS